MFSIFPRLSFFVYGLQLAPLRFSPNVTHFYKVLLPPAFSSLFPRPLFSPVGESFLNFYFITDKSDRTYSCLILCARHDRWHSRLQCGTQSIEHKVSPVLHGLLLDRNYVKKSKRAQTFKSTFYLGMDKALQTGPANIVSNAKDWQASFHHVTLHSGLLRSLDGKKNGGMKYRHQSKQTKTQKHTENNNNKRQIKNEQIFKKNLFIWGVHRAWIESMKTRFPTDFKHGRGNSEHVSRFSLTSLTQFTEILLISVGIAHYKVSLKALIELNSSRKVN